MKVLKKNPFWMYIITIIGIISYFVFFPLRVSADTVNQRDVASTTYFDITLLYWAIGIVGGCIAVTLIYVGYRKYKGEKKEKQSKSQHDSK